MNGSVAQNDTENGRWCDICAQSGHKVKLQYFQINYEDAILICPAKECTYPLDSKPLNNIIVKRKPEDIVNSMKRKRRKLDHNSIGKEVNFTFRKSMPSSGFFYEKNSSLRSSALDSLTAKIIENISQSGAISFLSLPVYNSFASNISCDDFSSVFSPLDYLHASAGTNSSISRYMATLSPAIVKSQDMVSGDYSADISSSINQSLLESTIMNSDSLIEMQSRVNATTSGPTSCELKTKTKALATAELVGQMPALSYTDLSLGQNSGNPIALYIKDQANVSVNLAEQNSIIPGKEVLVDADNSDGLNGYNEDTVILSSQNSLISVKHESMNSDKSNPLQLSEPDATRDIKQSSLPDSSSKHLKEFHSINDDEGGSTEKSSMHNESRCVPSKEVYLKFLQWKNKDSLCWLDVVMCLLMHCKTLRLWLNKTKTETCLNLLVGSFDISQRLFRQGLELRRCVGLCRMGRTVKLETSVGDVMVKTGGGNSSDILFGARAIATIAMDEVEGCSIKEPFDVRNIFSREDPNTVSIEKMLQEADRLDSLSKKTLSDARDIIFASLETSLYCEKGQNDSPLMALVDLLARDPVSENLKIHYRWTLNCSVCEQTHQDSVSKEVVTFLKLPDNFHISEPHFMRTCFSCKAPDQLLCIKFDRLPDLFFHHFLEGIHHCELADLDFELEGDKYAVTGLVQYKTNPDHFVSWLREPVTDFWMECDDLKNCVCKYSDLSPTIPACQVHIVMWEKQSEDSGYMLPCERESFKQVGRVQESIVDHVFNQFPPPKLTSLPTVSTSTTNMHIPTTSLPTATVLRSSSSFSQNGTTVQPLKDQDKRNSKLCTKTADNTRLQRMKLKYELDRKRSFSLNSNKPVIPRIPIGMSNVGEQPNRKNFHFLPVKMNFSGGRYSPSKIDGCNSSQKLSRTLVQSVALENNTTKPNIRAGRHNITAVQTRSLLKVGRQSYLETILPLITETKQSTAVVQKFEAYVPKSQKVTSASENEAGKSSITDRGYTEMKTRKPRVCFSECNLLNDKHELSESITHGISVNQMPTKGGILTRPYVLPKSTSQLEHKFGFDNVDVDISNVIDLDKILFKGNNCLEEENFLNSSSVACPLLLYSGGDASNYVSASIQSCAPVLTSTDAFGFDILSVVQENTSGFESTAFGNTLDIAARGSLPNLVDFIPSNSWASSLSGSSYTNLVSDCINSSVANSQVSNNALGNYLNGDTSGVYTGINNNDVTSSTANDLDLDFTNLPLPIQSFNFGEENWSWFS